jgi:hypothetical protein
VGDEADWKRSSPRLETRAIAPGRFADIISVEGNPLADITELERVRFVMKGGVPFKE